MKVYKTLKTPLACYVYDRYSNSILRISEEEFQALNANANNEYVLERFQSKGHLIEHSLEEIKHPATDRIKYYLGSRISQLILQVTQNCNLRCKYCAYSGNYNRRTHTNLDMSIDMAETAIDFWAERVKDKEVVVLGFYGGEPLLRMDFLAHCVDYVKKKIRDKKIMFSLTTNGTLLNQANSKFLVENDFVILISMDGAKEDHDKNRVFVNGKGSFDVIEKNVRNLYRTYPDYQGNVSFNAVLNENCDYGSVNSFYRKSSTFCSSDVRYAIIESAHRKEEVNLPEDFITSFRYDRFILLMSLINKCDSSLVSRGLKSAPFELNDKYWLMADTSILGKVGHHSGPCIPGSKKLLVTVEGDFYPCEKVPEAPSIAIGNIVTGFDYKKVHEILNVGCMSKEQCNSCWALTNCSICVNQCIHEGEYSLSCKLQACEDSRANAEHMLMEMCLLKEFGYNFGR